MKNYLEIFITVFFLQFILFSQRFVVEKEITLPDELGGLLQPTAICFDSLSNSYYTTGVYGNCIIVVDASTGIKKSKIVFPFSEADEVKMINVPKFKKLYCMENYGDSAAVINTKTNEIINYIPLPFTNGWWIYAGTDSGFYFTSSWYNGVVYKIDASNDSIYSAFSLSDDVTNLTFNPQKQELYASLNNQNKLFVVKTEDHSVYKEISMLDEPKKIFYDHSYNRLFVSFNDSLKLTIIDCILDTIVSNKDSDIKITEIEYASQRNKIYCNEFGNRLKVFDLDDPLQDKIITLPRLATNAFFNPFNHLIYAYSYYSNYDPVMLIDSESDNITDSLFTGKQPYGITTDNRNSRICIINSGDNSLSILNGLDNSLLAISELGIYIKRITADPDHNKVYANFWDIYCIDGNTAQLYKTIKTEVGGYFSYNPYNSRNYNINNYSYLDGITDSLQGGINVGYGANGIIFTDNGRAYTAHYTEKCINVLDLDQQQVIKNIPLNYGPSGGYFLHPDQTRMYINHYVNKLLTVLNVNTGNVIKTIPFPERPTGMLYDSTNDKLFISIQNEIKILKCSGDSISFTSFPINGYADAMLQHPNSGLIFATVPDEYSVVVINPLLEIVTARIPTGNWSSGILYYPPNDQILVANLTGDAISIIDCNTLTKVQDVPVGMSPDQMVYLPSNHKVFITCTHSSAVYVITDNRFVNVEEEKVEMIPDEFLLNQNYPNPFNPTTRISWQLAVGGMHTLKVFDVLGNEVATLVNEYKPGGNYEVEFNAANLSSGVYFYQLRAGNLVQTKKMILIK